MGRGSEVTWCWCDALPLVHTTYECQRATTIITGARKDDTGKPPIVQGVLRYFPKALCAVADVSAYGFKKYGAWGGWRYVDDGLQRYTNALGRHLLADGLDPESGLMEAAHAAWNALARLELLIHTQDEPKKGKSDALPPDVSDDDHPRGMWDHQP